MTMLQARPSADDFAAVHHLLQGLQSILEQGTFPDDEGDKGAEFPDSAPTEWLIEAWENASCSWQRLLYAGQVAIDNACDPTLSHLEFKPEDHGSDRGVSEAAGRYYRASWAKGR